MDLHLIIEFTYLVVLYAVVMVLLSYVIQYLGDVLIYTMLYKSFNNYFIIHVRENMTNDYKMCY